LVRDIAALALLLVLCLLFFWPILTPDPDSRGSFRAGDFYVQTYACSTYKARELLSGRLPLWNPHTHGGHPFLADVQNSTLYPPSLLSILLSAPWGYSVFVLELEAASHFFLAGAFTYFFGRRLFKRRGAALVAAIVFTFGGYLTSFPPLQLPILETAIWLPLILLLLDLGIARFGDSVQLGFFCFVLSGVAFGVAILAGHPQTAMYLFYVASAWYVYRAFQTTSVGRLPMVFGFVIFVAVAGGLAAVQLLPALELTRLSIRASAAYQDLASGLALQDLLQILLPSVSGFWSPLYIGILPLIWVLFAWATWLGSNKLAPTRRWDRDVGFWSVLALLALLLVVGGETFFYDLLYIGVPGFGLFRSQERAALVFALGMSLLVGYGLDHFLALIRSYQERQFAYGLLSRIILGMIAGVGSLALLLIVGSNLAGGEPGLLRDVLRVTIFVGLFMLAGWLWSFYWTHRPWHSLPALGLMLVLIVLDLFILNAQTNVQSRRPERQVRSSTLIQTLQAAEDDRPFRVHHGGWHLLGNYGCIFDLEDTSGASQLQLANYARFIEQLPQERAWELLNVRYVVTWQAKLNLPSQVVYHTTTRRGDDVYLHRLEMDAPRAWAAFQAEVVSDEQALASLSRPDSPRHKMVLLDRPLEQPLDNAPSQDARLDFARPSAEHLRIAAEMPTRGLLVFSELYYPGWQAWVDGQPIPIRRANTILRAVEVPAGSHLVEMEFRPLSFHVGVILSLLTCALILGYTVYVCVAQRGTRHGQPGIDATEQDAFDRGGPE
jgi:hypothetical protein